MPWTFKHTFSQLKTLCWILILDSDIELNFSPKKNSILLVESLEFDFIGRSGVEHSIWLRIKAMVWVINGILWNIDVNHYSFQLDNVLFQHGYGFQYLKVSLSSGIDRSHGSDSP